MLPLAERRLETTAAFPPGKTLGPSLETKSPSQSMARSQYGWATSSGWVPTIDWDLANVYLGDIGSWRPLNTTRTAARHC